MTENKKEFFTVKLEVLAPVFLTYKIFASSPEEAIKIASERALQNQIAPPKLSWAKMKVLKAKVFTAGTTLLRLTKIF